MKKRVIFMNNMVVVRGRRVRRGCPHKEFVVVQGGDLERRSTRETDLMRRDPIRVPSERVEETQRRVGSGRLS